MNTDPFIRIVDDEAHGACWEVVVPGRSRSKTVSGYQALELLRALSAAAGGPRPMNDA